jgi:hypothetical protein
MWKNTTHSFVVIGSQGRISPLRVKYAFFVQAVFSGQALWDKSYLPGKSIEGRTIKARKKSRATGN